MNDEQKIAEYIEKNGVKLMPKITEDNFWYLWTRQHDRVKPKRGRIYAVHKPDLQ